MEANPSINIDELMKPNHDTIKTKLVWDLTKLRTLKHNIATLVEHRKQEKPNGTDADLKAFQTDTERILNNLLRKRASNGRKAISTNFKVHKSGYGRYKTEPGSYVDLSKHLRWFLADGLFVDIDMQNCHPVIAEQLFFALFGKPSEAIKMFNNQREELFQFFKTRYGSSRDDTKQLVFKILYNGNVQATFMELAHGDLNDDQLIRWMQAFDRCERDFARIREELKIRYPEQWQNLPRNEKKAKNREDIGKFSTFMQHIERLLVTKAKQLLEADGVKVSDLQHDGFYIDETQVNDTLLTKLSDKLYSATGFRMTFTTKPFNAPDWLLALPSQAGDGLEIESDRHGAELFIEQFMEGEHPLVIRASDGFYHLVENVWRFIDNGGNPVAIMGCNYLKNGKVYTAEVRGANAVFTYLRYLTEDRIDHGFLDRLNRETRGLIFYRNGIWNLETRQFEPFNNRTTLLRIERDYVDRGYHWEHPEIVELIRRGLACWSDETRDYNLNFFARALGGYIGDKAWAYSESERNSGRGGINTLFAKTFGEYVTVADTPIARDGGSDQAADARWVLTCRCHKARLCFMNELKTKDKGVTKLDGNLIKKIIASGGDKVSARRMRENEVEVPVNCLFALCFNSLPKVDPADAMETSFQLDFPYKFCDNPNELVKEKQVDRQFKYWVEETEWIANALEWVLYHTYQGVAVHRIPKPNWMVVEREEILDEVGADPRKLFTNYYTITGNADDMVPVQDIVALLKETKWSVTKIGTWLRKTYGVNRVRKMVEGERVYFYTSVRVNEVKDL